MLQTYQLVGFRQNRQFASNIYSLESKLYGKNYSKLSIQFIKSFYQAVSLAYRMETGEHGEPGFLQSSKTQFTY